MGAFEIPDDRVPKKHPRLVLPPLRRYHHRRLAPPEYDDEYENWSGTSRMSTGSTR
ncbi:MAG: hypothetical protein L6W00_02655 [Lentisphaeria bacterium]|nr:MAG: hypothetical protein L6W00_02655 [Lentisphaeria bacterium]